MSKIRLFPSGQEIDCPPEDTVLFALEAAGYALPNNCRAGACGECKVKVRQGRFDQGFVLDMALSQEDRAQGFGLMCMAKPLDDVLEIEWGTQDAQPKLFPPRQNIPFIVVDRVPRTPSIMELRLRPVGEPMRFWPGQYIMMGAEAHGIPSRSYSIANAPRQSGEITLQIARVDDGVTSRWIHDDLHEGTRVEISGPYGTFIGDPGVETPILCLAAGSGLAPLLALTDAALRRGFSYPVTILFSARTRADVYDLGLMEYWQEKYRNFKYLYTLTREKGEALEGRIPDILAKIVPDLSAHSVFIAGSPEFVEACVAKVKSLGAMPARIYSEGYFGQHKPEMLSGDRYTQSPHGSAE